MNDGAGTKQQVDREQPTRLLLVDDDPLVRSGLRLMFGGASDVVVVGEAGDGDGIVDVAVDLAATVVLMDVRMPRVDGVTAVRALRADDRTRGAAVIMLTTFRSDAVVLDALRAGAAGFLLKHSSPEAIVEAVRAAAAGHPTVSPLVLRQLIEHVAATPAGSDDRVGPDASAAAAVADDTERRRREDAFARLSAREQEIAFAVADGLGNGEIAARHYLSLGSVKTHISNALGKLALDNRIQLAILAHDVRRGRDAAHPPA